MKTPTERLPLLAYLAGTSLAIVSSFVAVVELDVELLELDDESLLLPQAASAVAAKATATMVSGALREVIFADDNARRTCWQRCHTRAQVARLGGAARPQIAVDL